MSRAASLALCAVAAIALAAGSVAAAFAAFGATAVNGGNVVSSSADFSAPDVAAVAIGEGEGGTTGTVAEGGAYHVYANVLPDGGNPPSGIAAVTADVAEVTAGSTAVPLVAGSYSAGGQSYSHRSVQLTADSPLAEGERGFSVTAVDNASNQDSEPGTVLVDNGGP